VLETSQIKHRNYDSSLILSTFTIRVPKINGGNMKKKYSLKDINIKKYYIFTRPTKVSDFKPEDWFGFDDGEEDRLLDKARHLRARRWRKIKHQWV